MTLLVHYFPHLLIFIHQYPQHQFCSQWCRMPETCQKRDLVTALHSKKNLKAFAKLFKTDSYWESLVICVQTSCCLCKPGSLRLPFGEKLSANLQGRNKGVGASGSRESGGTYSRDEKLFVVLGRLQGHRGAIWEKSFYL